MISRTTRYALGILGYLADRPGQWVQVSHIARDTSIPANYLSKTLNQLRKRGLVLSRKGWGGGFQLALQAKKAPILQVAELFEGRRDGGECLFGLRKCDRDRPCPLHPYWESIQRTYLEMMSAVRIGDLQSHGQPKAGARGARA